MVNYHKREEQVISSSRRINPAVKVRQGEIRAWLIWWHEDVASISVGSARDAFTWLGSTYMYVTASSHSSSRSIRRSGQVERGPGGIMQLCVSKSGDGL